MVSWITIFSTQQFARRCATACCLVALVSGVYLSTYWFLFPALLGITFALVYWYEWRPLVSTVHWLTYLTPVYLMLPFYMMIRMAADPAYRFLLLITFGMVALFDTAALLGGMLFGTHLLVPRISPRKTYEGAIAGYSMLFIGCLCLGVYYTDLTGWQLGTHAGVLTIITGTFALAGDLFESWIKRLANRKDSGTLLPGHGGILDRIDACLFVVPFVYMNKEYLLSLVR